MFAYQRDDSGIGFLLRAVTEIPDQHVARLTFYEGGDTVIVTTAHDGVDFPVAFDAPCFDGRWSGIDHAFSGESAARVVAVVSLTSFFRGLAQVRVEFSAMALVFPDMLIDGFVADLQFALDF